MTGSDFPAALASSGPLDWAREGPVWPHHEASRFVKAAGLCWHVQRLGRGPTLLLIHGTGASTHSWRDLMGPLAKHFDVIAIDLPGHGFTDSLPFHRLSLPGVARALAALLTRLNAQPALIVGHSAGAAVALRMVLDGMVTPAGVISLSGALKPYGGAAGPVFNGIARLLFATPVIPWLAAREARNRTRTRNVIENTGSTLTPEGQAYYDRLLRAPSHIQGALGMMASWNVQTLINDLKYLKVPLLLVGAEKDHAVPPQVARDTARLIPGARVRIVPGLGHLAHEENPALFVTLIEDEARRDGVLPVASP